MKTYTLEIESPEILGLADDLKLISLVANNPMDFKQKLFDKLNESLGLDGSIIPKHPRHQQWELSPVYMGNFELRHRRIRGVCQCYVSV